MLCEVARQKRRLKLHDKMSVKFELRVARGGGDCEAGFGQFIRTFTFGPGVGLPIVQPGGNLEFPIPTVPPLHVKYVESSRYGPGLELGSGTWRVAVRVNPSVVADFTVLVNGQAPKALGTSYEYTHTIRTDAGGGAALTLEYDVVAPRRRRNILSIQNTGSSLFTVGDIPNTRIGDTALITEVTVQRLGDVSVVARCR